MDAVLDGDETGTIAHRDDIQGLRGVAVALVVLGHAHLGFSGGFIGVDVFFVLSGFLITSLLLKEASANHRIDFRRFYARRAARLIPASTVTILVTVVASIEILNFIRAREVLTDGLWATGFAANIHFGRVERTILRPSRSRRYSTFGPLLWRSSSTCCGRRPWAACCIYERDCYPIGDNCGAVDLVTMRRTDRAPYIERSDTWRSSQ